jgi:lipoprotein Spr
LLVGAITVLLVGCASYKKTTYNNGTIIINATVKDTISNKTTLTQYDSIRLKYAKQLSIKPESIDNPKLYYFIDSWLRTPYKWGGTDRNGIDCSAFVKRLLAEVYDIYIPRTSESQFMADIMDRFRSPQHLIEGDLVFFRTLDDTFVSHVGLYLRNNWFVNSSSSKGVSLGNLNDPYWKKHYVAAARIIRDNKVVKP